MDKWTYDFRIAFKRLNRQYSKESEEFMLALAFLARLSEFHSNNFYNNTFECLKSYYEQSLEVLKKRLENNLKGAKEFVVASNFNQQEANDWIKKVENQNATSMKLFLRQNLINYKLFDCIIDENQKLKFDNSYIKKLISKLYNENFQIYAIEKIEVINAIKKGIGYLSNQLISNNKYDILTNGTYFTDNSQITWEPCGTVITKESFYESDRNKVENRGGLVVLESGIINIASPNSNCVSVVKDCLKEDLSVKDLDIPELKNIDNVVEYLGGGAHLIDSGKAITGRDLYSIQQFDQLIIKYDEDGNPLLPTNNGFDSMQLAGKRIRIYIAKYNEIPFLLKVEDSAKNVQKELQMNGFSDLICFDGGGGLYFNNKGKIENQVGRDSPSGLAIKVREL